MEEEPAEVTEVPPPLVSKELDRYTPLAPPLGPSYVVDVNLIGSVIPGNFSRRRSVIELLDLGRIRRKGPVYEENY